MSVSARLVTAFVLLASTATAQTTREDGIRALVAGNYQAAARILAPLAEDDTQPDPLAQFLLAILYDSGQGVARNEMRACGLFATAATPANPFMQQSSQISSQMLEVVMGPLASQFCVRGAKWHDAPAARFTLAPDHRVIAADGAITVTYHGTEQRVQTGTLPGAVSLPLRYTPLDVTRPAPLRRHFMQWFIWMPDVANAPANWTLGWALSEVVGAEYRPITGERSLVTVSGSQAPASYDLVSLARVHVNADGEAEWIISGGANPRSGVIAWTGPR